uniref:Uncharacterized protein n=1 Tax=Plectus sambesii TaxID=2011161 RepID=A0A914WGD1_9BILA
MTSIERIHSLDERMVGSSENKLPAHRASVRPAPLLTPVASLARLAGLHRSARGALALILRVCSSLKEQQAAAAGRIGFVFCWRRWWGGGGA